ncbi:MAG: SDR family oxidoreductase [Bacteroidota bacterium]|nr:SDR family oxidoreductase [Bacteroidota bacterium]
MSTDNGYALVTGASQGIGKAIALELASRGFGVIATARNRIGLEALCAEAGKFNGGRTHSIEVDLWEEGAVEKIADRVKEIGKLTCLVNNAGQGLWGLFDQLPLEEQVRMMRLNMDVPVALTYALLPELKKQSRGYILNISSMVAYHALASMAVYSGSKAFILRWSRSLRLELKGKVNVTCVCPGSVITGFTQRAGMTAMDDLAKKFGTPPEPVAKAAVDGLLRNKAVIIPGGTNRFTIAIQKLMPTALTEGVASGIYLKRLPRKNA